MTLVQIDDRLYVEALQYVADQDKAGGAIQMLEGWLSGREEDLTGDRVGELPHMLAGLTGHYSGTYDFDAPWDEDKTLVWSFFRAWLDRDGRRKEWE